MRMWMIEPKFLCQKHLLGEHGEIHKHRHNFVKEHSIAGRRGQIEPESMETRHNELAAEMSCRGYAHNSPYSLPNLSMYDLTDFKVDIQKSFDDLMDRCLCCAERIKSLQYLNCNRKNNYEHS